MNSVVPSVETEALEICGPCAWTGTATSMIEADNDNTASVRTER
jgi:hypothetical protein